MTETMPAENRKIAAEQKVRSDALPLRVVMVGEEWPPSTFLRNLIQGMIGAGVDFTMACSRQPDPSWLDAPGFHWLQAPAWSGRLNGRVRNLIRMSVAAFKRSPEQLFRTIEAGVVPRSPAASLRQWHRLLPFSGIGFDVIYFPWNNAAIEYMPLFETAEVVLSCRGAQVNVAPHNPRREAIRSGLRKTFQMADGVHCVSEDILEEAVQYGLDVRKARVIRPAVDAEFFQPPSEPRITNGIFRIVSTGSLIWRKGYEYALLAIRALADRGIDVQYDIIGSGPERDRLIYTIGDLNLTSAIRLHGTLSPADVRERLQRSDVFLLTSLSEGISNAALEAMACGLPVVTTDCGGMREAVAHGEVGFVGPVRDVQATAASLLKMANDPSMCERMGQAARRKILKEFRLDHQVRQFVALCQTVSRRPSTHIEAV